MKSPGQADLGVTGASDFLDPLSVQFRCLGQRAEVVWGGGDCSSQSRGWWFQCPLSSQAGARDWTADGLACGWELGGEISGLSSSHVRM